MLSKVWIWKSGEEAEHAFAITVAIAGVTVE